MTNEQSPVDHADDGTAAPAKTDGTAAPAKAKTTRSRRASSAVTSPATSVAAPAGELASFELAAEPAAKAPVRRTRAKKAVPSPTEDLQDAQPLTDAIAGQGTVEQGTVEQGTVEQGTAAKSVDAQEAVATKRPVRRRATSPVTAPAAVQDELPLTDNKEAVAEAAPIKAPVRRRRVAKASAVETPVMDTAVSRESASSDAPDSADSTTAASAGVDANAGADAAQAGDNAEAPQTAVPQAAVPQAAVPNVVAPEADVTAEAPSPQATDSPFQAPASGVSALFLAPDLSLPLPAVVAREHSGDTGADNNNPAANVANDGDRRGRRGRNRRSRGADATDVVESHDDEETETEATDDGVSSRRRRRRRRGDADLELSGGSDDDPPNTVTRVRAPRTPVEQAPSNRVTSLRGSTRLEAKKQRRRDSRDSGRRRTVITEAEFLARRESVDRVMVVRQGEDRIQIGVLEDGILSEHFVSKTQQDSLIGNVYVGKVQNVLPSMEAAFVDIGRGRNAVLYAGEVDWDAADLNGQPRRIENALKSGDSVLVQVSKDPVGHKGARLTSQISLPGRYLVFVPGGSMTGISRKLPDVERNRLKRVLKDHLPENAGVIVRTAAEGASEEELTNDINRLRAQWEGINNRAASTKTLAPEMLYGEPDLTIKVVRDVFNEDFTKLIVSGEDAWDTIEAYVTYVAPDLLDRLEKWSKPEDIFAAHRIDEQINKALERKVFLPSGGSLVIDRTEAMTVVDVNTGKFTGSGGNLEETVTKNNLEAAEEVVRQLRLRDIGGIIVIDFIDMVLELNRDLVLRRLVECLGRDRTKHQVAEVTSLGLVQMTRKRMGTGLLEVFGEQCPACAGRGMVTHEIPVEHRRTHSPAIEAAPVQPPAPRHEPREPERTANRSTRSERKRNRNRSQQLEAEQMSDTPAAPMVDEAAEAAKAQKAHEARLALAAIAAAAAASHHDAAAAHPVVAPVSGTDSSPATSDAATLTLGGEAVELPRGQRTESSDAKEAATVDRAAALAELAQALDQLAAPAETPDQEPARDANGNSPARASRRPRRNRSARSAQGGADTAVETVELAQSGQGSTPHSSAAVVIPAAAPVAVQRAKPIILGVGVPASEL